jgi:hypothetical protein
MVKAVRWMGWIGARATVRLACRLRRKSSRRRANGSVEQAQQDLAVIDTIELPADLERDARMQAARERLAEAGKTDPTVGLERVLSLEERLQWDTDMREAVRPPEVHLNLAVVFRVRLPRALAADFIKQALKATPEWRRGLRYNGKALAQYKQQYTIVIELCPRSLTGCSNGLTDGPSGRRHG